MPYIDIPKTFNTNPSGKEEALAMVVNSIAFEEANLAELIDAQSKELEYISKMLYGDKRSIELVIDINQSINSILEKAIRLNIHHQLVLEDIYKIFSFKLHSTVTPDASEKITDIDATVTAPDMATEPDNKFENVFETKDRISKTTATKQNCMHILKGRGVGIVRNESDYFCEGISIIQVFVCSKLQNYMDNFLCYSAHNSASMQILIAFPDSLKIECCLLYNAKKVEIKGQGKIIWKERYQPDVIDTGAFILNVVYDGNATEACSFEMTIKSKGNSRFDHYSGKIKLDSGQLEQEDRLI